MSFGKNDGPLQWWQSWLMSYFNGGRRRAWWTFWATSVVWGLACLPLNLTLCDASPSPKTNNYKSNNWNFFSAETQSHTHNHQEQDRPKIWWTAAIEKHPFAGNMNHNRTSKSLKKREWRCDTWGIGAKKGIRENQTMKGDLFSAGVDRPVFKIAMEMKKLRTPELNNVYDFSVVCVRVFLASYLKYSD